MPSLARGWQALLVGNLAVAFYNVGMIWLAQLNWMLWALVGPDWVERYRLGWWHGLLWAVFPMAALGTLGVVAQLCFRPPVPRWMLWSALGAQLAINVGTVLWWGPSNAEITVFSPAGALTPAYHILVQTHWIRVSLYTLAGLLQLSITLTALVSLTHATTPSGDHIVAAPGPSHEPSSPRIAVVATTMAFTTLAALGLTRGLWTLSVIMATLAVATLTIALTTRPRRLPVHSPDPEVKAEAEPW